MRLRTLPCFLAWALCAACDEAEDASWRAAAVVSEAPPASDRPLAVEADGSDEPAVSELFPPHAVELTDAPRVAEGVCSTAEWKIKTESSGCGSCSFQEGVRGEKRTHYGRWCYVAPSPPSCGCEPWEYQFFTCAAC